jgi:hypothetical protein
MGDSDTGRAAVGPSGITSPGQDEVAEANPALSGFPRESRPGDGANARDGPATICESATMAVVRGDNQICRASAHPSVCTRLARRATWHHKALVRRRIVQEKQVGQERQLPLDHVQTGADRLKLLTERGAEGVEVCLIERRQIQHLATKFADC